MDGLADILGTVLGAVSGNILDDIPVLEIHFIGNDVVDRLDLEGFIMLACDLGILGAHAGISFFFQYST